MTVWRDRRPPPCKTSSFSAGHRPRRSAARDQPDPRRLGTHRTAATAQARNRRSEDRRPAGGSPPLWGGLRPAAGSALLVGALSAPVSIAPLSRSAAATNRSGSGFAYL